MISQLEKEITIRYLKSRKKDSFLNIISIFSFIGIGLGVAVLIVVMSVMNGFRTELINKIVGFNAHVTVKPYEDKIEIEKLNNQNLRLISKNIMLAKTLLKKRCSKERCFKKWLCNKLGVVGINLEKRGKHFQAFFKQYLNLARQDHQSFHCQNFFYQT